MNEGRTRPTARWRRAWPTLVYVGLLVIGIPWYWPSDNYSLIFGMPGWVGVAIAVSFAASIFTAWLLRRPWPMEPGDSGEDPDRLER